MQNKITHIVFILTQHFAQQEIKNNPTPLIIGKIPRGRRYERHPQ
jgi:hypothetical protein